MPTARCPPPAAVGVDRETPPRCRWRDGGAGAAEGPMSRRPPPGGASQQGGGLSPPLLDLDNGSVWLSDCLMGVIWEKVRVLR